MMIAYKMKCSNIHFLALLILFGAFNTLLLTLMNIQQVGGVQFFHPFIQTLSMFMGEMLVGIVYVISKRSNNAVLQQFDRKQASNFIVMIPATMDLFATLLSYIALNMTPGSVWQISRGGNIISIAILSRIFLKQKFSRVAVLGCIVAFSGITGVQLVNVLMNKSTKEIDQSQQWIGIILLVVSIVFNGVGLVTEKWIFNKYSISALKMVFLQGLYGFIAMLALSFGFQYVKCPWQSLKNCVKVGDEYYLQNWNQYFSQLGANYLLILFNVGLVISIGISVPIAVSVSKQINPVSRALADVCRTLLIWAFGIILAVTIGQASSEYKLETTDFLENGLKLIGFLLLVFGTLMYHNLVPLPCLRNGLKDSLLLSEDLEQ